MNFGWTAELAVAHAIMHLAHERGTNFFDTANVYGFGERKAEQKRSLVTGVAELITLDDKYRHF
jgi:aryl-alcohol dehydrogenase-like predicted oxidoreductase